MAKLEARSALGRDEKAQNNPEYAGRADAVLIRELPLIGCVDVRVSARNDVARQAVAGALGATLPGPNAWVAAPAAQILWQAFDEWLLVARNGSQNAIVSSLRGALAGTHCAITDVSDLRAAFELRGPRARDVLQKGCAVDLHPRVFSTGSCVNAALARVRVTLRQMDAVPTYEVLVERSYGGYLWSWLMDAAAEYV